jgi:diguanylate cyclase (GGDEF)-like protein
MENIMKPHILIVDDVFENIKLLTQIFKDQYKTSFTADADKVMDLAISDNPPDIILLDIIMPQINGYDLCIKLKENSRTCGIPVIFITSMNNEENEANGFKVGAVDYITKPFRVEIVKARVQTHIELKRHRDMFESLSFIDGLTGISNRRRFDEYLNTNWRFCLREKAPLSLIMVDIDYFKAYNDSQGHLAGDDCLKGVSAALACSINRPLDFIFRYGGEEFAAILPLTDVFGAMFLAEKMREKVKNLQIPHPNSMISKYVTVSIGAADIIPSEQLTSEILIKLADKALYNAKDKGRNCVVSSDCLLDTAV